MKSIKYAVVSILVIFSLSEKHLLAAGGPRVAVKPAGQRPTSGHRAIDPLARPTTTRAPLDSYTIKDSSRTLPTQDSFRTTPTTEGFALTPKQLERSDSMSSIFSDASSVSFGESDRAPSPPIVADPPSKKAATSTHLSTLTEGVASKYALDTLEPTVKEALVLQLKEIHSKKPQALLNSYTQHLTEVQSSTADNLKASRAANKLRTGSITPVAAKESFIKKAVKEAFRNDLVVKQTLSTEKSTRLSDALTSPTVAAAEKELAGLSASEAQRIAQEKITQATAAENATRQAIKELAAITTIAEERKATASQAHADAVSTVAINKKAVDTARTEVDNRLEMLATQAGELQQINNALEQNKAIMATGAKSWSGMVPGTQTYNNYYKAEAAIKKLSSDHKELTTYIERLGKEVKQAKEQLASAQTAYKEAQQTAAEKEIAAATAKNEADKTIQAATEHKNAAQRAFESAQLTSQSTTIVADAISSKEALKDAQQQADALHLTLPTDLGTLTAGVKISGDLAAEDVINNLDPRVKAALVKQLQSAYKTFEKRPTDIAKTREKHLKKLSATDPSYRDDEYKKNTAVTKLQALQDASPEAAALKAKEFLIKKYIKSALQYDAELKRANSLKAHLATDYRATNQQTPPEVARLSKITRDAQNVVAYVDNTRKGKVDAAWRIKDAAWAKERAIVDAEQRAAREAAQKARLETVPGKIEAGLDTVKKKASNVLEKVIRKIKEPKKPKEPKGTWAPKTWAETFEGIKALHERLERR